MIGPTDASARPPAAWDNYGWVLALMHYPDEYRVLEHLREQGPDAKQALLTQRQRRPGTRKTAKQPPPASTQALCS
jgi:hypothetical protein